MSNPSRGCGRGRGGRSGRGHGRTPPISLMLDPEVDVSTDEENEDMQPTEKEKEASDALNSLGSKENDDEVEKSNEGEGESSEKSEEKEEAVISEKEKSKLSEKGEKKSDPKSKTLKSKSSEISEQTQKNPKPKTRLKKTTLPPQKSPEKSLHVEKKSQKKSSEKVKEVVSEKEKEIEKEKEKEKDQREEKQKEISEEEVMEKTEKNEEENKEEEGNEEENKEEYEEENEEENEEEYAKENEMEEEEEEDEVVQEEGTQNNENDVNGDDDVPDVDATVHDTMTGILEETQTDHVTVEEPVAEVAAEIPEEELEPLFPTKTRSKRKLHIEPEIKVESSERNPTKTPTKPKPKSKKRKTQTTKAKPTTKSKTTKKPVIPRVHLQRAENEDVVEEKVPLNACQALIVTSFGDSFKNDVLNHLNTLGLSEDTMKLCVGILGCCFHSGRRYKLAWYDSSPAFLFFKNAMKGQGWVGLMDKFSSVFVSELCQFYATVKVDVASGTLSAIINSIPFELTLESVACHLEIPMKGLTTFPKREWGEIDSVTSSQVMEVLRPHDVDGPTNIYATELSAPNRFIFNLLFCNIFPSNNSRGRCSLTDMLLIHHIVKHIPINLPYLMFHRINELALELQDGNFDKHTVIPYGMWLSFIFDEADVIAKGSPSNEKLNDEMNPGVLSRMSMEIRNGKLVRKVMAKGEGSNVDMSQILAWFDALTSFVTRQFNQLKDSVAEMKQMHEDLLERLS